VVTERVLAHYAKALVESEEAVGYLKSRGLEHPELLERFRLGYADRTLGYHVPRANRAAGEALRGQLARLGFYRESGREHFYGSITIPIFDAEGQLAQMYGRKIRPQSRDTSPHHLYMPRPHTAVWNVAAL
jgi:DNA primase